MAWENARRTTANDSDDCRDSNDESDGSGTTAGNADDHNDTDEPNDGPSCSSNDETCNECEGYTGPGTEEGGGDQNPARANQSQCTVRHSTSASSTWTEHAVHRRDEFESGSGHTFASGTDTRCGSQRTEARGIWTSG